MVCRKILADMGQDPDDVPGCNLHHVLRHGNRDHKKAFGLCLEHHQTGQVSIHGNPAEFKRIFGTEEELMILCYQQIGKSSGEKKNGNK